MQKVLLTGASGGIGYEVFCLLSRIEGIDLTILIRESKKNLKKFKINKISTEVILGDLTNPNDFLKLIGSFDVVIHLAAIIPPEAYLSEKRTFDVNVLGTELLIERIQEIAPNAFFMFSSSVAVYGDRLKNPEIRVSDPLNKDDDDLYVRSKIKAEEAVRYSQLNWTIFRLTAILGVNNHKVTGLMFHMPLNTPMEITTPSDAARAFVNSLEKKTFLSKRVFNLGGGASFRTSYRELLEENFKINGLGALDFPEKTFAEKNFHCGYMLDSDDLEDILHYRKHTLADYYRLNREAVSLLQKSFTYMFRSPIKFFLQQMSAPLKAFRTNNLDEMKRFF